MNTTNTQSCSSTIKYKQLLLNGNNEIQYKRASRRRLCAAHHHHPLFVPRVCRGNSINPIMDNDNPIVDNDHVPMDPPRQTLVRSPCCASGSYCRRLQRIRVPIIASKKVDEDVPMDP